MSPSSYPTRKLGANGPGVSAIGFGTMGIGYCYPPASTEEEADTALTYAINRGHTLWDCADIYGSAEEAIGRWLTKNPSRRKEIFLCSKFGAYNLDRSPMDGPCSDPAYVKQAFQRSLSRLNTDYIDLYYQHRVDAKVPIEVVLETLREPVEKGQIRWLGLSECSTETLRRAKAVKGLGEKIIAVQMEFSPFTLDIEKNGFSEAAEELGVSVVAYSPLARGLVSGKFRSRADFQADDFRLMLPRWSEENFPKNLILMDKIKVIADRLNSTPSQVTLAWILAEHPTWIPIPGSRTIERIDENAKGAEITLSTEDVKAIRQLTEDAEVAGLRYAPWIMEGVEGNCIPLSEWSGQYN